MNLLAKHVAAQIGGPTRKVVENGQEFLVAPIVAVKEGVLNGELVRMDVLNRLIDEWQDTPVTVRHPPEEAKASISKTHAWVRANTIGTMRNVRVANERLQGEVWIPTNQTDADAVQAVQRIERNETMEVSVGMLSAFTGHSGTFGGERFREVTQEAAPNHVALLPDEVGACSIDDGCGTPRAASSGVRVPDFTGIETTPWQHIDRSLQAFVRGASRALSVQVDENTAVADLPPEVRQWIAQRTMLGNVLATTEEELLRAPVVNPATDRLNRGAVMAVFGHRTENLPIESSTKLAARQTATTLLKEQFGIALDPKAAAQENRPVANAKPKTNGARMGAALTQILNERTGSTGNTAARRELIGRLATAAEIEEARVRAIVAGNEDFTEDRIINTFANVLEVSSGLLAVAAIEDVDDFMAEAAPDSPVQQQPSPSPFFFTKAVQLFKAAWQSGKQTNGGEKTMDRCALEASIKDKQKLSDADAAALKSLSGGALKAFAEGLEVSTEGFKPEAETPTAAAPVAAAAAPAAAAAAPAAAAPAAGDDKPLTRGDMQAMLKQNNEQLLETVTANNKAASEAAERATLSVGAKAKGLSDEDIASTPLGVLRKLVGQPARTGLYAGAGGAAAPAIESNNEAQLKAFAGAPHPYDMKAIERAQERFRSAPPAGAKAVH